jgi:L-ascorbate metabolism protein UlaG (beta-lactamase superfamily)
MKKIAMAILALVLSVILAGYLVIRFNPAFGAAAGGKRMERILKSPNFKDGKFQNPVETKMQTDDMPFFKVMKEFIFAKGDRVPAGTINVEAIDLSQFRQAAQDVKICWLGHSAFLIEIDGKIILTDPVFSKRVSPFSFFGTKSFIYSENYTLDNLPPIDLVLISHDHYDHLDYQTIKKLRNSQVPFVTALGVGAHLEHWGISPERITELDWWEDYQLSEKIKLTATPARHFSGRGLADRFSTLWASWVIAGSQHRLFFGADSGYFPGFKTIGEKYGPFDLAMLECGQYSRYWPFIHLSPEETFQAANDLKAKSLLPIHWGKYKLSIHPWTEPVERLMIAAQGKELALATPKIGQVFGLKSPLPSGTWWR